MNSTQIGLQKDLIGGWAKAAKAQGWPFRASVHAAHAWSWYETAQGADTSGPLAGVPYDGKTTPWFKRSATNRPQPEQRKALKLVVSGYTRRKLQLQLQLMAHISLPAGLPGIVGPMTQYPETEVHLNGLAHALLRGPSSLSPGERDLIATFVSSRNNCHFCTNTHRSATRHLLEADKQSPDLVDQACHNFESALLGDKMRSLLVIAGRVQEGGRSVSEDDVDKARACGADDKAIHDTVLIAAAFCMFNRYVDGLATWAPEEQSAYDGSGARLAREGYLSSIARPAPDGENV